MHKSCRTTSVRTASSQCKPQGRSAALIILGAAQVIAGLAALILFSACAGREAPRIITLDELENAPQAAAVETRHLVVSDPSSLRDLCRPLGPRLGLLQVRTPDEWRRLAGIAPQIGPCPDFRAGILIGLACWAGTPVDGHWPLRIDAVRLHDGAALVEADFRGGTYLPDTETCLEIAHVAGAVTVLAVDVNGTKFFPD
jgi:hypothetical protein